jgi:vacuolar-type H+-ATPase subunit I/STV1
VGVSIFKLFSPSDPDLVEKILTRLAEQDTWNDVFSTKLIELLDKSDQVKREIRERMRKADERIKKAESVEQAESLLLEEAAKAEELKSKLTATERALDAVRNEFLSAKNQYRGAEDPSAPNRKR